MIAQESQQNEEERLEVLRQYNILDSPPEPAFDDLTSLVANLCDAPISFITFVDKNRQWVKSQVGLHGWEIPKKFSVCAHPIPHSDLFIVPDTNQDLRFADHPWVTGDPHIRFYAGAPLQTPEGCVLGTLGVLDRIPRVLNARQQEGLTTLSRQVVTLLELRHHRKLSRLKVQVRGGKNEFDFMRNAFSMPMAYVDATLQYRFTNQAYGAFLGIPTGTLEGRCIKDVLGQAAYETIKPYIDKVLSGQPVTFEQELPCSQDNTRYVEAVLTPDFDGSHAVKGFGIVVKDLTNGRGVEERFRLAVEAARCGMVMSNQEGKIVLINSQTERLFGYTREELMNQPLEILVPEPYCHTYREYRDSVIADRQPRFMGMGSDFYGLHKSKATFPVEIQLSPIMTRDGVMVLNSILDITERKRAEAELESSHSLLTAITEGTPDVVFAKDMRGRYLMINSSGAEIIGKPVEEILGKNDMELFPSGTGRRLRELDQKVIATGQIITDEEVVTVGDTSRIFQSTKGVCGERAGKTIGTFGIARDITKRKKAEAELVERNQLLSLDAEIGHIINKSQELGPILQRCTEALVQHLKAAFARIWTLNAPEQILELQASAGLYTRLNGPHSRVPVGQFKIGQIASEKKPLLTNAVIGDPHVPEQEWAKREGLVAFAGYPLLKDQDVVGVMALFSRHPLTEFTMKSLEMVADRITMAIERQGDINLNQRLAKHNERILASAGEGIYGLDLEGKTTFVNPAGARMLGYRMEELLGVPMHSTMHHTRPDGSPYPQEACPMYAAFKDGSVHHIEDERLWRKDGTSFPVDYTSTPIWEDGRLVGAVVTFQDITQRKRAQEGQATLQNAVNQAMEGLALLDNEGIYTYMNPAHAAMYGYSPEELLGRSWKSLYSGGQIRHIEQECFPLLKTKGHWQGELIGQKKNGDSFAVEVFLTNVSVKEDGDKAEGLICSCRDITERKQAEEAINRLNQELEQRVIERTSQLEAKIRESQEAQERIQSLAKFPSENPNPVLRISREGRVLYGNKASRSLLKAWNGEKGQSLPDSWHQIALEGFSTNLLQQREVECRDKVFSLTFAPIEQSDYMNIYGLEVTNRKRAEEQIRKALKEKEVLLKEIHHRVKNNLQVVSSLLSLQAERLSDDHQREPFQASQDRLQAMILIHEQLYRLENLAEISFGEFIERQAHELYRVYDVDSERVTLDIRAEGVRLEIDKAIPCGLIVTELLTNALKYAFPGKKAGKITIQLLSGQDGGVMLKISDNGVGLPDSLDIRRANSLGMRLVCALTDQLEGNIKLTREGGAEFIIQFPQ